MADWNMRLGRFWSHEYAAAIVEDPDAGHVWLLTRYATLREFNDAGYDGSDELAAPSDEYRQLGKTAEGWELRDLDGTVQSFDGNGRWTQTTDRNGNAKVATYIGDALTEVSFPDGRRETFSYDLGGRLEAITEVGVDGTTTRTWTLTWNGNDLTRIDRPDCTAWEFVYDDSRHPGHMTRMILIGTVAGERIEGTAGIGGVEEAEKEGWSDSVGMVVEASEWVVGFVGIRIPEILLTEEVLGVDSAKQSAYTAPKKLLADTVRHGVIRKGTASSGVAPDGQQGECLLQTPRLWYCRALGLPGYQRVGRLGRQGRGRRLKRSYQARLCAPCNRR